MAPSSMWKTLCITTKVLENPLAQLGKLTILFVRVAYTNIATIQELDHRR